MQKKALEEHGPFYNSDLATHVTSGPFKLVEFDPGSFIAIEANEQYKGYRPPLSLQARMHMMSPETMFAAYQNGEIDMVDYEWLSPADFDLILSDPVLSENYLRHFGDFRTDYLMFDTFNPPFDNLDVRKAFAHAVDREAIVENVFTPIKAMPAHSMLMPGYPSSDTEGVLAEYQAYDCEVAKQHLADAGYPDGEGFPSRNCGCAAEGPAMAAVYQATAASIAECLNIDIEVSNKDYKVYTDAMNASPRVAVWRHLLWHGLPGSRRTCWASGSRPVATHGRTTNSTKWSVRQASWLAIRRHATRCSVRPRRFWSTTLAVSSSPIAGWVTWSKPNLQGDAIRVPDSNGIAGFHWGNDSAIVQVYLAQA